MADIIADSINEMFKPNIAGIPVIVILIGIFIIIWFFLPKKKAEEGFKRKSLYKEMKRNTDKLFEISEENLGFGRTLRLGPNSIGLILKMINFNWYEDIDKTSITRPDILKQIDQNKEDKDFMRKVKDTIEGKENIRMNKAFYGFKVVRKGLYNKILAYFGSGIKYYFIDKDLVTFNPFDIVVNPTAQYTNFINIIIFSGAGMQIVNDIAFKIYSETLLDELINVVPKQTMLEIQQAKGKLQLDMLESINAEKRKEQLEQIKKA